MLTLSDKGADLIYFTEDFPMAKTEQITTKTKIAGYEKEVAQLEQLKDFLHNAGKICGLRRTYSKRRSALRLSRRRENRNGKIDCR